jgi:hypothetical protein
MAAFLADPAALIGALFMPIVVGCLVLGTITWFAGFGFTYWAVGGWRRHRAKRLAVARQRRSGLQPENDNLQTETPEGESPGKNRDVTGYRGGKGTRDHESEAGQ